MSLDSFFTPRSVAVVGASREAGKVGHELLVSLIQGGFAGPIYPINPKADEVEGRPCYRDLTATPSVPDLVIIVVPSKAVVPVMKQCAAVGVKAVILITAGFKEVGAEGAKLEREVLEIARAAGVRMIGPNCLGVMVPKSRLNASFGGDLPSEGGIAYLSQSGALMSAILDMANAGGIGFSKLMSIGNKADLNELDLIQALGDDPDTKVITGYLENILDGQRFITEAEKISRRKPILLMKAGGTAAGAKAASSHTGSLAGGDTVYNCLFDRTGIVRCPSIKAQFDYAQAFAYQPLPRGSRVVVVTNAGGPGIMAADAIEREGMTFAKLSDETMKCLAGSLPHAANVTNPVDVLGDALADRYEFAMKTVLDDPNTDAMIVLLTPQVMTQCTETAQALVRVSRARPEKPVLACFMGALKTADAMKVFRDGRIPQFDSPESAARTIKVMSDYANWRARPERVIQRVPADRAAAARIVDEHLRQGLREIGEMDAKSVLAAYGFVTPKGVVAATADEAVRAAEEIGYPVVMKIWSPDILHKSDVGGVRLGLADARQVTDAYDLMMYRIPKKMPQAKIVGVSVQEMCRKGQEVILGVNRDRQFGAMMMFGLGGILVEVLKDVTFSLAPLTESDAREMLTRTRTYQILKGVRGQAGSDIDAIVQALLRLSQLVTDFPQIKELDINPFVVGPAGTGSFAVAVDARISVEA